MTLLDDAFNTYLAAMVPVQAAAQQAFQAPCTETVMDAVTLMSEQTTALLPLLNAIVAAATPVSLPVEDPLILGALWNQGGTVLVSFGPFMSLHGGTAISPGHAVVNVPWTGLVFTCALEPAFLLANPNLHASDFTVTFSWPGAGESQDPAGVIKTFVGGVLSVTATHTFTRVHADETLSISVYLGDGSNNNQAAGANVLMSVYAS